MCINTPSSTKPNLARATCVEQCKAYGIRMDWSLLDVFRAETRIQRARAYKPQSQTSCSNRGLLCSCIDAFVPGILGVWHLSWLCPYTFSNNDPDARLRAGMLKRISIWNPCGGWVVVATMWTIEHHMVQPCSAHLQPVSVETILAGKQLAKKRILHCNSLRRGNGFKSTPACHHHQSSVRCQVKPMTTCQMPSVHLIANQGKCAQLAIRRKP